MPDVSSLLSSWKAEREKDAFPLPCLEGVVLREEEEGTSVHRLCHCCDRQGRDDLIFWWLRTRKKQHLNKNFSKMNAKSIFVNPRYKLK